MRHCLRVLRVVRVSLQRDLSRFWAATTASWMSCLLSDGQAKFGPAGRTPATPAPPAASRHERKCGQLLSEVGTGTARISSNHSKPIRPRPAQPLKSPPKRCERAIVETAKFSDP